MPPSGGIPTKRSEVMISHVSVGVKDIESARKFYDAALGALGCKCLMDFGTALGYGEKEPELWVMAAERPVPPDEKSGLHLCFDASSRKAVDNFHAEALKAGARDNGKPGIRKDYGDKYYAAFVVDPNGYRLEAYCAK
jgi:catechol 2,3-dioxygenase-like lactoylglutathione lyase family enzyme